MRGLRFAYAEQHGSAQAAGVRGAGHGGEIACCFGAWVGWAAGNSEQGVEPQQQGTLGGLPPFPRRGRRGHRVGAVARLLQDFSAFAGADSIM
jgi:hypothetical protein